MNVSYQSIPLNTAASRTKKIPFTLSERKLIVALVRERPIIEDKKTNAKNIELKKQAWQELTMVFNKQPYVSKRNSQQLKRCWENIKTLRKKEVSHESYNTTMFLNETDTKVKRCIINIQQDQALHDLRIEKEKILIQREKNQLMFEEEMHKLQLEKIILEINMLKQKIET